MPNVTIFAESGALANPFGMAFDQSGNLWVVGNNSSQVYEYTKSELVTSGAPTPHSHYFGQRVPERCLLRRL